MRADTLALIHEVNTILGQYTGALTLRQIYYRLVAAHIIPNDQRQYKRLSKHLVTARLLGLVDDTRITDRTRSTIQPSTWTDLESFMRSVRTSYRRDKRATQPLNVEVWVEKDAVAGVLEGITARAEVVLYPCRGYNSYSALKDAADRIKGKLVYGKQPTTILYLGDFDPSGQDMARDIVDRLEKQFDTDATLKLLALSSDQVEAYDLPPMPTKRQDSRAEGFIAEHGDRSVELDALPPDVLQTLVRDGVASLTDPNLWNLQVEKETAEQAKLTDLVDTYEW